MRYLLILFAGIAVSQDETVDLDLEALWENTVWEEIQDVTDEGYEVEKVTAVAGVRGAEAEDEALALLYYRRSMKGLTLLDLNKAYGKLKIKRDKYFKKNPKNPKIIKMDKLLINLQQKINSYY